MEKDKRVIVFLDDDETEEEITRVMARIKRKIRRNDGRVGRHVNNQKSPDKSSMSLSKKRKFEDDDSINIEESSNSVSDTSNIDDTCNHTHIDCHPPPTKNARTPKKYENKIERTVHFQENEIECQYETGDQYETDYSKYVSLDCEFVGTGPKGCNSVLGRCTIVDYSGRVLCDIYSKPEERITDFRTPWSGLRPSYIKKAIPLESARSIVKRILKDKILIGHAVYNDLRVLGLNHPKPMIRDTSCYPPLQQMAATDKNNPPRSLKKLSLALLGRNIQHKTHCSQEDAIATLDLFKLVQRRWEMDIRSDIYDHAGRERTVSETSVDNSFLSDSFWPSNI